MRWLFTALLLLSVAVLAFFFWPPQPAVHSDGDAPAQPAPPGAGALPPPPGIVRRFADGGEQEVEGRLAVDQGPRRHPARRPACPGLLLVRSRHRQLRHITVLQRRAARLGEKV